MTLSSTHISVQVGHSTEDIVASAVTGSRSQEEVLKQLDSIGIEWYVTNQGDLSIKAWQIAAENFIPAERVDEIRQGHVIPDDGDALEWVSANLKQLTREHAGSWIAIKNNAVVAASTNLQELLGQIEAQSIQNPFLTQVPAGPIIWETAFANEDI